MIKINAIINCKRNFMHISIILIIVFSLNSCYLSDHQIRHKNATTDLTKIYSCDYLKNPNSKKVKDKYLKDTYLIEQCINSNKKNIKFLFGVIEFDDFGQLRSQKQFEDIKQSIKNLALEKQIILTIYVHGWRHNASEGSSNLTDFRKFVIESALENPCSENYPCTQVGIYIAWRGDPTGLTENVKSKNIIMSKVTGVLKTISINNRMNAAKKVSSIQSTHVILDLIQAVNKSDSDRIKGKYNTSIQDYLNNISINKSNDQSMPYDFNNLSCHAVNKINNESNDTSNKLKQFTPAGIKYTLAKVNERCSKIQLIGHSFGARFLENALSQSIVGQINVAVKMNLNINLESLVDNINNYLNDINKLEKFNSTLKNEKLKLIKDQKSLSNSILTMQVYIQDLIKSQLVIINNEKFVGYQQNQKNQYQLIVDDKQKNEEVINHLIKEIKLHDSFICNKSTAINSLEKVNGESYLFKITTDDPASYFQYYNKINYILKILTEYKISNTSFKILGIESSFCLKPKINNIFKIHIGDISIKNFVQLQLNQINNWVKLTNVLLQEQDAKNEKLSIQYNDVKLKQEHLDENRSSIEVKTNHIKNKEHELILLKNKLLENYLQITMVYEKAFNPPADITMLLNPATEALTSNMLNYSFCKFNELNSNFINNKYRPWIVSIASSKDWATKWAFPVFTNLKLLLGVTGSKPKAKNSWKGINNCNDLTYQYNLITKTAPFIDNMITHFLEEIPKDNDMISRYLEGKQQNRDNSANFDKLSIYDGVKQQREFYYKNKNQFKENDYIFIENKVLKISSSNNKNFGYWVMKVGESIMENHNDIFNSRIGALTYSFMKMTEKANFCDVVIKDKNNISMNKINSFKKYCESQFINHLAEKIHRKYKSNE